MELGKWRQKPEPRRYKWMHNDTNAYDEVRGEIRRHAIKEKERRKATIVQRYIHVAERSITAIPTSPPARGKIAIMGKITRQISEKKRITQDISITCPKQMENLITNVKIEEDNKF